MSTKRVTYKGRHTNGVFVPHEGHEYAIGHGETVELPSALADKLAGEQPDAFVIESTPKKKAAAVAVSEED